MAQVELKKAAWRDVPRGRSREESRGKTSTRSRGRASRMADRHAADRQRLLAGPIRALIVALLPAKPGRPWSVSGIARQLQPRRERERAVDPGEEWLEQVVGPQRFPAREQRARPADPADVALRGADRVAGYDGVGAARETASRGSGSCGSAMQLTRRLHAAPGTSVPYLCVTRRPLEALSAESLRRSWVGHLRGRRGGARRAGRRRGMEHAGRAGHARQGPQTPLRRALPGDVGPDACPGGAARASGLPHPELLVPYEALMRRPAEALRVALSRCPAGRRKGRPDAMRIGHCCAACRMPTGILDLCRALQA